MKRIVLNPNHIDNNLIKEAARIITNGGIVALPTETVYGLAARADRNAVVDRLYKIKKRSLDKPFSYVVDLPQRAVSDYLATLPPFGYRLVERFWPGPLTLVYYSVNDKKIGIRVPANIVTQRILSLVDLPVFLPSANFSGEPESTTAEQVETLFKDEIEAVVDAKETVYEQSSTVVDMTKNPFDILRVGVIRKQEIIELFVKKRITFVCTGNTCRSPMGEMLLRKYIAESKPHLTGRYEIISRGISAYDGSPATANVVSLMNDKEGINARVFSAQRLDRQTVLSSDYIFCMEKMHRDYIVNLEPTAGGRTFTLAKFLSSKEEKDIPDPIGKDVSVYEHVYRLISEAVTELKDWL